MTRNILHLTYDMRIGGTEMVIKNIIEGNALTPADDNTDPETKMSILCIESPLGPFGEQLQEQGIQITNLNWQGGFDKALIKQIRQYIKQHKIEVLHCHQYSPWVYGSLAAAFTNTKVVFTEHGRFYPDSSSWKRKFINPVLVAFTHKITAISKATKQALVDFEFIPESKIQVLYNGIKPLEADEQNTQAIKAELNIPEDAIVLGTVARLDPIKNQTMMIRAFAQAAEHNSKLKLMIVGDGEERDKLETLVDELTLRSRVIFTGYNAKPVNHINLMDIFLLSSLSEGTSMTLLEAMSLSKPCIVTNAGGNPEIIEHNLNGLVTENDNADAFAQAIIQLAAEPEQINTMGEAAKQRFEQLFHYKKMTELYSKLY